MIMSCGLQAFPRMFFSCMDVAVDLIYLIDLLLNFRMGFLEEGHPGKTVSKLLIFVVVKSERKFRVFISKKKNNVMNETAGSLKPQSQV